MTETSRPTNYGVLADDYLEEVRQRAEAATEGVWHVNTADYPYEKTSKLVTNKHSYIAKVFVGDADADFIANARQDIPKLLAEIDRLKEELADARAQADTARMQVRRYADVLQRKGESE